jgi:hypothetical protein
MAFSLEKWITGQMESARLNDANDNWTAIEGAIDTLQTALDGKAASSHSHSISNVSGLQSALDGKAASSHNHTIDQITNLQSTLDGKAASNHTHNYAPSSHNHTIAQVTDLQTALDGKEATLNTDQKRKITISTSDPSGGANGDIWIKV